MEQQVTLPFDVTSSKHHGNQHSKAANLRIQPHKANMRERIRVFVCALDFHGATIREIAQSFGKFPNEISGRLTELKMTSQLFDSGRDRDGCSVLVGRRELVKP